MSKLLRWVIKLGLRYGFRRGLLEGNRVWVIIGGAAVIAHLGGRALGGETDVVFSELLEPGETFQIHHERRR